MALLLHISRFLQPIALLLFPRQATDLPELRRHLKLSIKSSKACPIKDHERGSSKNLLEVLKMDKAVRTIHVWFKVMAKSRHTTLVALLSYFLFSLVDIGCTLNNENSIVWCSTRVCWLGFFFFFLQPWVRFFSQPSIGKPTHKNEWYASWLSVATAYHLPGFRSVGVSMRMNASLFLITFVSSILSLFFLHLIFEGLPYIFSRKSRAWRWPDIWTILNLPWNIFRLSSVAGVACCVFTRYCIERPFAKRIAKLANGWLPVVLPEEIFYAFVLWIAFIVIYLFIYIRRRSMSGETQEHEQKKPEFEDMVPWYSGTSADLYKTVFDLLVSVTVFLGRFDMRILQAAITRIQGVPTNKKKGQDEVEQGDFIYDLFAEEKELWFDFMADTGDGGNSTYTVAKLVAQPSLHCTSSELELPRGKLLLIGGDLAYPNPSQTTYEKRLFFPFERALQPPPWYKEDHMAANKPQVPRGVPEKGKKSKNKGQTRYDGPRCFIIPGNHDWFDGLYTFMGNICYKNWLGGWYMPQRKSYFALKLPKGWWVFGLDLALHGDIDVYQFEFFSKLTKDRVGKKDSVIVMTHQPEWLLNWYANIDPKTNVSDLICNILQERCKLRIAGDIHHYMHHSSVEPKKSNPRGSGNEPVYAQHLLVNGCGGAYVHPTHPFRGFSECNRVSYKCNFEYPPFKTSRMLAFRNIWNFRKQNWQFDFVGGIIYFLLVFSMFPQCELDHLFQVDPNSNFWRSFSHTVGNAFIYMLERSYVSLGGALLLLAIATAFIPAKVSLRRRVLIGILHVSAHLAAALILMLVLELGVETFARQGFLATSGYHSLYRRYQSIENKYFPVSNGTRAQIEQWTLGFYPACIKYILSGLDVPELMAVTRSNICKNGMESISRWGAIAYYVSVFLYFWVLSTPFVSLVFGSYLYICINWLNLHYDEAFSSLRIADYKSFTRFHIKHNGDLEVFTLAVDKVPVEWTQDDDWTREGEITAENELGHNREFPSQWKAAAPYQDPLETVRIIDRFIIGQKDRAGSSTREGQRTAEGEIEHHGGEQTEPRENGLEPEEVS